MKISEIKALWDKFEVLPHIRAHMQAVANNGKVLALQAQKKGLPVNPQEIYKAGLLHDLFRLEENHEAAIANYLIEIGEPYLSDLVRFHGHLDIDNLTTLDQKIVFYADKRVCEDKLVSLHERFEEAKSRNSAKISISPEKEAQAEAKVHKLEAELKALLGQLPNHF